MHASLCYSWRQQHRLCCSWIVSLLQPPAVLTMHLPPIFSIVLPLATALVGIFTYNHGTASIFRCPGFLNPFHSPHHSSWNTWFHPFRSLPSADAGSRQKDWNILYHLGGNGPWIEKIDGDSQSLGIAPPEGCSVDQVHMVWTSSSISCLSGPLANQVYRWHAMRRGIQLMGLEVVCKECPPPAGVV